MADSEYKSALINEARSLTALAIEGALQPVFGRETELLALQDALRSGGSALLVGPSGVGKTALVYGLARSWVGPDERSVFELSTSLLLTGTRYLGEWQSKLNAIVAEAEKRGAILYITDLWNLPTTGRTQQSDTGALDFLRPHLLGGRLTLIGEVSAEQLRQMERVPGFVTLFRKIAVDPLGEREAEAALLGVAERMDLRPDAATRASLITLSARFFPARPQPAPALDLLRQLQELCQRGEATLSPEGVERALCRATGLPEFVVSRRSTRPGREIRQWFQERIVGQPQAIEAVLETIALFKAGLHDPSRPIGTFFFVGPTGVGKTELARALATYLFGGPERLLRFDLSEFKDFHSFETLLGSAREPSRPAALVDPVRAQPFQVVLLDELEKAHPNVWDLLLPLLDEGRLTPPGGPTVDFRSTLVIATSNVGAVDAERALGFASAKDAAIRRRDVTRALEGHFRPEFLNRFQHVVIFHPLTREQVREIARQELRRVLAREGITGRDLVVEVDDAALDLVIERGFDPRYGARALKRELQHHLVVPLALTLMEEPVEAGQILRISAKEGQIRVRLLDSDTSRENRAERAPVKVESGRRLGRDEVRAELEALRERVESLAAAAKEPILIEGRARLEAMRDRPDFWLDIVGASRAMRDLERARQVIDRLDNLRAWGDQMLTELGRNPRRERFERLANDLERYRVNLDRAHRELVILGWDGLWDAIVELSPIGARGRAARDLLISKYTAWAESQRMTVVILREPKEDNEPGMIAVKGPYAAGLLRLEAGLHRVRDAEGLSAVARVRVAPWTDERAEARVKAHKALKADGQLGGKLRARVECEGGLIIQCALPLNEARELALDLAPAWNKAPAPVDAIVRRVELSPPKLRDPLTGLVSGRPDAMEPEALHALFLARLDAWAAGARVAREAEED